MSAVAERAGVTRATLYRHFPSESILFEACSAHWLAENPPPDFGGWMAIADPTRRLRVGLEELYGYFRATEQMMANLLRDLEAIPPHIRADLVNLPSVLAAVFTTGWPDDADAGLRRAAIGHAIGFDTWRSLTVGGLTDAQAAELMVRLVACAGDDEPGGSTGHRA